MPGHTRSKSRVLQLRHLGELSRSWCWWMAPLQPKAARRRTMPRLRPHSPGAAIFAYENQNGRLWRWWRMPKSTFQAHLVFLEKRVEGHYWIQCWRHLTPADPTVIIIQTLKNQTLCKNDLFTLPMSTRRINFDSEINAKLHQISVAKMLVMGPIPDLPQTPLPLSVQRWSLSPIYDHPARNPRQAFGARVLEQLPTHQLSSISSDTTSDIKTVVVSCPNGHDWRTKQMSSNSPWKLISEIVLERPLPNCFMILYMFRHEAKEINMRIKYNHLYIIYVYRYVCVHDAFTYV